MGAPPKIFCNGISKIEMIGGGCARYTLFENAMADGKAVQREVGFVVAPLSAVPHTITQLTALMIWGGDERDEAESELPIGLAH